MTRRHRRKILIEMVLLLGVPPALVLMGAFHLREFYPFVLLAGVILYFSTERALPPLLEAGHVVSEKSQLRHVLIRYALCVPVLIIGLWWFAPEWLFAFPKESPKVWLIVMLLYPLVSALMQEVLYRGVFFRRWGWIFNRRTEALAVNAAAFAWLHIFFPWPGGVPLGFLLSIPAGWFFAQTYLDSRSFRLVWFEHALYGNTIFTLGLGKAFYLPM